MNADVFAEQSRNEGRTILRVSRELRDFLADAPPDNDQARSLLRDCDTLDRVGQWLATTTPILASAGIPAAGPGPHIWTPDDTKNRCLICGDGVWGRHRFQSSDPHVALSPVLSGS